MKKTLKQNIKCNDEQEEDPLHQKLSTSAGLSTVNRTKDQTFFNTFDYIFMSVCILVTFTYLLSYFDDISWQLSSLGRILMIKILPYYDWRNLKNKNCLINSFFKETETVSSILNCNVCEDIIGINVHESLEEDILEERYINLDNPVVITKGLKNWPNNSNFIEEFKKDSSKSYPCNLSSNMYKGLSDLGTVLSKIKYFDQFYIHFQNCELDAMKSLRRYTLRPGVLPSIYSPTLYNWLIWNKGYNVTNYKQIELVEKVTVLGQLFGATYVRLIPRKNCEHVCPFLDIVLLGGELLVFTSLWDLEYRPVETGENMAVIMEYRD